MKRMTWEIRAEAVLAFALIYFFDGSGIVSAAVPAVLVHELGHCLALWLCGRHLRRVTVSLSGIELDYSGVLEGIEAVLCIAAGPAFGLLYALAVSVIGGRFAELSGALSFALTAFNLLPVLPLDGGRLLSALTNSVLAGIVSRGMSIFLLLSGTVLLRLHLPGPLLMAGWLTVCNFRR